MIKQLNIKSSFEFGMFVHFSSSVCVVVCLSSVCVVVCRRVSCVYRVCVVVCVLITSLRVCISLHFCNNLVAKI